MNKQQLLKQREEIDKQIKELEEQEKANDFIKVIYTDENKVKKEIRIYKWKNKRFGDFPMPKGFDWCEHKDLIGAYDKDLVKLEIWNYYFVKHYSKKQQKTNYPFARVYPNDGSNVYSNGDNLADSNRDGWVVISRVIK